MKILFIGGTGNISAECARLLHQRHHDIFVLSRGHTPVPSEYHALQADRKDLAAFGNAVQRVQPDVVIDFLGYDLADVQNDFELFRDGVRQFIFISSATVYAKPPARLPITEDAPLGNPAWEYAQKKLACEQWLLARHREQGFPVTIVRPSHTYSKHWVPNPVSSSSFTYAARLLRGAPVFVPDNGENPWTLTAASDFAAGLAGLTENPKAVGQAFHITSDEVLTWNQIVAAIADALGAREPRVLRIPTELICRIAPDLTGTLKGDKIYPGVFDNRKLKTFVPDFRCRVPFRTGVKASVQWLLSHPEQQNLSPKVEATMDAVVAAVS